MQSQMAMRQAFADNVDPQTGQINQQGALSEVGKTYPLAVPQLQSQFSQMDKAAADAQAAKMDAIQKTATVTGPAWEYLAGLPSDQRAQAYPQILQQIQDQGVDTSHMPSTYDPGFFSQTYATWRQMKPSIDAQVAKSEMAKNYAEMPKVGATELGTFTTNTLNPSSRTPAGQLYTAQIRAQRLIKTANEGIPANASEEEKIAAYNKLIPQIANMTTMEAAALAQGGAPDEQAMKATGLTSAQSSIAKLRQGMTGNPTSAQLGALLNSYVDYAKAIGGYSNQQRQKIAAAERMGYPNAERYFPKRMDAIQKAVADSWANGDAPPPPEAAPNTLAAPNAPAAGADFVPNANAAPNAPAMSAKDQAALNWLKTTDPTDPTAFKVRAKLRQKGVLK
jgi:hypothetical protein